MAAWSVGVPESVGDSDVLRTYFTRLRDLLGGVDYEALERIVDLLRVARDRGSAVYVAGNGGSAAAASHFATDLAKATRRPGKSPLRVLSLTDNTAWLTALANDEGYEHVFTGQLESLLRDGDVLILISASGNSPNVIRAAELARQRGAKSVALVGFDGGQLLRLVDISVHAASETDAYGPVEDTLLAVHHAIAACLARA